MKKFNEKQNVTCTYNDPNGYQDFKYLDLGINYYSGDSSSCNSSYDSDCGGIIRYDAIRNYFYKADDLSSWGNTFVKVDQSSSKKCSGNQCNVTFVFYYPGYNFLIDNNDARTAAWDRSWYS
ncbi:MAG: hypothetical protein MUE56_09150, partial [Ignavibacteria bacterium]|nr:hypothetical protein [Ignavibacteria bacterium]